MPLRLHPPLALLSITACALRCTRATSFSEEFDTYEEFVESGTRVFATPASMLDDYSDLPPLSHSFAPWNPVTWKNTVALCASMNADNVTDVMEWLNYYRWLGVEHVYLTETSADSVDTAEAAFQPLIEEGFLTLDIILDEPKAQLHAYQRCIVEHRKEHNWMLFVDVDEYLAVREEKATLPDVLDDYKFFAGVSAWWVMVGSGGQEHRPAAGGVLRTYTGCEDHGRGGSRLIANLFYAGRLAGTPHNIMHRGSLPAVAEDMLPMAYRYKETCMKNTGAEMAKNCDPLPAWGANDDETSIERLAVFHYVLKSRDDFLGESGASAKDENYFKIWTKKAGKTSELCSLPSTIADECCAEADQVAALQRSLSV